MSDSASESFLQRHSRDVAERLIRQMEEGTGPFVQLWDARMDLGLPMNPTTGKSYRGGNREEIGSSWWARAAKRGWCRFHTRWLVNA